VPESPYGHPVWDLGSDNTITGMTKQIGRHLTEDEKNAIMVKKAAWCLAT
jgi:hypothetical protein